MRFLLYSATVLSLLLFFAVAVVLALSVEPEPLVAREVRLSPEQVRQVRDLAALHDPRKLKNGQLGRVVMRQADLLMVMNYLAGVFGRGGAEIQLGAGVAQVRATLTLPPNPIGRYVNVEATLHEGNGLPRLDPFRIGRVPVPPTVTRFLLTAALDARYRSTGSVRNSEVIQAVSFSPDRMTLSYRWNDEVVTAVRDVWLPAAQRERFEIYNAELAALTRAAPATMPLSELLHGLFGLARERSVGGDWVPENQAVTAVLSLYVTRGGVTALVPEARGWSRPARRTITLAGRRDLAQHFLVSAALAAHGGDVLAYALGELKELDDASGGSGFSFRDLGADKAGTALGLALVQPESAERVQQRLARVLDERDFMPTVSDLEENMQVKQFAERYGSVDDARYREVVMRIDDRIAALPLYR
jgi:hypothetical protein